ncbi:TRIO and F-actin-binding protein-like [Drosophila obscura]|uniref:TRIO and F-actin-binding protein-like n=1 Tax=Drosophila obscura TaxID=7282 RepID=UPI001BB1BBBC|nr:TRIO and F-actin-binding protein-like [Drosophila obscura]
MEPGAPLVVQSEDAQGQHTIVIRIVQPPQGAIGPTQCMPISVQAIPMYTMMQTQPQSLSALPSNPNYSSRMSQRQSKTRAQRPPQSQPSVQAYCCECSTEEDLAMPTGRDGGRSNGNRRCRQVCYKVEYMLCPEDAIYCNQFSDVRGGTSSSCLQSCDDTDQDDSQAEQDCNNPMGNIPRKCKFQCESQPNPQEEGTVPDKSDDQAIKVEPSEQSQSQEMLDSDADQMEQKTEDAYRRDQSTNTNTQECPAAPDLEYIKAICESLGRAMVACATAAVEAAGKLPPNMGHGRSASNWVTRESSYFMEQTPEATEPFESRSWGDSQPSIRTERINPQLSIGQEEAPTDAAAENSLAASMAKKSGDSPGKSSSFTLRSIQQQLDVTDSRFGARQPSTRSESKVTPDDTTKSTRCSDGSAKGRRSARGSTQSNRPSAPAAKRKSFGSASAADKKKSPRGSASATDEKKSPRGSASALAVPTTSANEQKSYLASAAKRPSSRRGSLSAAEKKKSPRVSLSATGEKKSPRVSLTAADRKKSPRVSLSGTERKSSSRDNIKGAKSSGMAAEQKSSARGSATASEGKCGSTRCSHRCAVPEEPKSSPPGSIHSLGNAAEEKDSPRESIRSGKSSASVAERKNFPRTSATASQRTCGSATCSIRKAVPVASTSDAEQKSSPSGSIHSVQNADHAAEEKNSPRESIRSEQSTASAAERKDSIAGSIYSKKSSGNAAEQKDSPRESIRSGKSIASVTERKNSPRESILSGKSSASVAEQKNIPRTSATASQRTCGSATCSIRSAVPVASTSDAEQKSSPSGSIHSVQNADNAAEEKNSPRESIRSGKSIASVTERKNSPRESIRSEKSTASVAEQKNAGLVPASDTVQKNSPSGPLNATERKTTSRAQGLANKKATSVGKLGGNRSSRSGGAQSSQPLAKGKTRTSKEPNQRTSSKDGKRRLKLQAAPATFSSDSSHTDETS